MYTRFQVRFLRILIEKKLIILWCIVSFFLLILDLHIDHDMIYNNVIKNHIYHIFVNLDTIGIENILLIITILTAFVPLFEILKKDRIFGIRLEFIYNNISTYNTLIKCTIIMMLITKLLILNLCFIFQFFSSIIIVLFYFYEIISVKIKNNRRIQDVVKKLTKQFKKEIIKAQNLNYELDYFTGVKMLKHAEKREMNDVILILCSFIKQNINYLTKNEIVFYMLLRRVIINYMENESLEECKEKFQKILKLFYEISETFLKEGKYTEGSKEYFVVVNTGCSILLLELSKRNVSQTYLKMIVDDLIRTNKELIKQQKDNNPEFIVFNFLMTVVVIIKYKKEEYEDCLFILDVLEEYLKGGEVIKFEYSQMLMKEENKEAYGYLRVLKYISDCYTINYSTFLTYDVYRNALKFCII